MTFSRADKQKLHIGEEKKLTESFQIIQKIKNKNKGTAHLWRLARVIEIVY